MKGAFLFPLTLSNTDVLVGGPAFSRPRLPRSLRVLLPGRGLRPLRRPWLRGDGLPWQQAVMQSSHSSGSRLERKVSVSHAHTHTHACALRWIHRRTNKHACSSPITGCSSSCFYAHFKFAREDREKETLKNPKSLENHKIL